MKKLVMLLVLGMCGNAFAASPKPGKGSPSIPGATTWTGNQQVGDSTSDNLVVLASSTFIGRTHFAKTEWGTASGASGVYVSSQLVPTSNYITILSSGGGSSLSGTPTISTNTVLTGGNVPFPDGYFLILTSTAAAAMTFVDNDTLAGSLLELGAATRAVGQNDTLILLFNRRGGKWIELSFTDN